MKLNQILAQFWALVQISSHSHGQYSYIETLYVWARGPKYTMSVSESMLRYAG